MTCFGSLLSVRYWSMAFCWTLRCSAFSYWCKSRRGEERRVERNICFLFWSFKTSHVPRRYSSQTSLSRMTETSKYMDMTDWFSWMIVWFVLRISFLIKSGPHPYRKTKRAVQHFGKYTFLFTINAVPMKTISWKSVTEIKQEKESYLQLVAVITQTISKNNCSHLAFLLIIKHRILWSRRWWWY